MSDDPRVPPAGGDVRIVPLGGLGEVGMNCLAVVVDGRAIVIDCGVTFDGAELGVDVVHADFSFLDTVTLVAVIVTHGHEDHIGAIPYLLRRHDVPVYGPPYALTLLREKLAEHEVLDHARLHEVGTRAPYTVGPFELEHVRVTHSIADATSLVIRTKRGIVIHTGDFKVDETPPDGEAFDHERFRELGDEGVALLMSDSTNAESDGFSGSEAIVGGALERILSTAEGAVIVGLFASNVHRLKLLGELARKTHRRIVIVGRSIHTHLKVARATDYLDWPSDLVFPVERIRELPRRSVLALATGTQAETQAALAKLSRDEHPHLSLEPGDAVVFSSRVIPGNDPEVYALMSALLRRGIALHTRATDRELHVSGHGYRGEQRHMLELVRPRAFIPLHGTRVQLERHARLAKETGVGDIRVLENGETAWLTSEGLQSAPRVHSGRVHRFAKRELTEETLKARKGIAEAGVVVASLVVDAKGALFGAPLLDERGVTSDRERATLLAAAKKEIVQALAELPPPLTDERIAEAARFAIRRSLGKALGKRPVPIVQIARKTT